MKKNMVKWFSLGLSVLFILSFISCGPDGETQTTAATTTGGGTTIAEATDDTPAYLNRTGYPIVKEQITLKVFGMQNPLQSPWETMPYWKYMEKLTGIHFEFETAAPNQVLEERKTLMFSSGNLPDVFFGANFWSPQDYDHGKNGDIIALEGLIDDYMPALKSLLEQRSDVKNDIIQIDGHIYSTPYVNGAFDAGLSQKWWINQKWLDNLGLNVPASIDELYDVLKAFKNNDPNRNNNQDEIPFILLRDGWHGWEVGITVAPFGFNGAIFNRIGDTLNYAPYDPKYKTYLEYMNRFYNEGLINNDCFTLASDPWLAQIQAGNVGVFCTIWPENQAKPEQLADWVPLPPLTSPVSSTPVWPRMSVTYTGTSGISRTCKYPEAAARFLDYGYTTEGSRVTLNGPPKGPDNPDIAMWEWVDDAHTQWKILSPWDMTWDNELWGKNTPSAGTMLPTMNSIPGLERVGLTDRDRTRDAQQQVFLKYCPEPNAFLWRFADDEQEQFNEINAQLDGYVSDMRRKFITGEEPLTKWDDYIAQLKNMGVDKMNELIQKSLDRYLGK